MKRFVILSVLVFSHAAGAEQPPAPREVRLSVPAELTRADLYVQRMVPNPKAVLVLCPGMNGNGKGLLTPVWTAFAREHQLGLVALSFASSDEDLQNGRGYYYPSRGAGKALLDGLRSIFGRDLPVMLYGMSGGAHFTARFTEWNPSRVVSWCAYTAAWWDQPKKAPANPPGIVACGDEDVRYGATLGYFLQGRALGKPWTWVSLPNIGHQSSPELDEFVRTYFATILDGKTTKPEWRDLDLKSLIDDKNVAARPALACWLPDDRVAKSWLKVHQP